MELYIVYALSFSSNLTFDRLIKTEENLKDFIIEAIENKFTIIKIINNLGY